MSWSFSAMGKPENVVAALKAESERQTGQTKVEFDDALPHMLALVEQNFGQADSGTYRQVVEIEANGSGVVKDGVQTQRSCSVAIRSVYKNLV